MLAAMNIAVPPIYVLDDEAMFCRALARLLNSHDLEVVTFTSGEELLTACAVRPPSCLLLDLHMPGVSGFEILERIDVKRVPVLVITGHDQPGNAERVRALGGLDYFLKPVNESQLLAATRKALAQHQPNN